MKKLLSITSLFLFATLLVNCSSQSQRLPASLEKAEDLISIIDRMYDDTQKGVDTNLACAITGQSYYQLLFDLTSQNTDLSVFKQDELKEILTKSFYIRLKIKELLSVFSNSGTMAEECLSAARNITRALRYVEDYTQEFIINDQTEFHALSGSGAHFLKASGESFTDYNDLQSGDIILSRGNAFTSAAIARIAKNDAQFSHLSFVYRDPYGKLFTIESHIEIGVVIAPFQVHIDQGNSREVVFRYQDQELAHKAAEHMFNKVKTQSATGQNIEYDFGMDYHDNKRIFCSEVAYDGFNHVSKGKVDVPMFKSKFNAGLIGFLNKMGIKISKSNIKTFETFAPGDLEFDPRFDLVAEWKDPTKMKQSRTRDAILTKMFEWIETKDYEFKAGAGISSKSILSWVLRRTPFIKRSLRHKFPKNMRVKQLKVFLTLDKIGESIEKEVNNFQDLSNHPLAPKELFVFLEGLRERDLKIYSKKKKKSIFHRSFRAKKKRKNK